METKNKWGRISPHSDTYFCESFVHQLHSLHSGLFKMRILMVHVQSKTSTEYMKQLFAEYLLELEKECDRSRAFLMSLQVPAYIVQNEVLEGFLRELEKITKASPENSITRDRDSHQLVYQAIYYLIASYEWLKEVAACMTLPVGGILEEGLRNQTEFKLLMSDLSKTEFVLPENRQ